MKILAFAASNSRNSINRDLVSFAATLLDKHEVEMLNINDYEMPIYSSDLEAAHGIPDAASNFLKKIEKVDALLISYAEHNGNYTVAYKNLFDWASRKNIEIYQGKPIIMLASSPGAGGAKSVLALARDSAHFFKGNVVSSLSIPSFYDNFDSVKGELKNAELLAQLKTALSAVDND
ncbi:NAD(P)H-dependent FMN reductase [Alteromonadaceae bacterium Bs31]|nr:NAD(P)H-dependent FMN reductase [Alteromonadaceae bacterium Bs31]